VSDLALARRVEQLEQRVSLAIPQRIAPLEARVEQLEQMLAEATGRPMPELSLEEQRRLKLAERASAGREG
jgi:hypothetical protein